MIDLGVNQEQKEFVTELLSKVNFGKRGISDGDYGQQFTGVLGQVVLMDNLGIDRYELLTQDNNDYGVDVKKGKEFADIKTMGRTVDVNQSFVNNLLYRQFVYQKSKTTVYIFQSFNKTKDVIQVVGLRSKRWIDKNLHKFFVPKDKERVRANGTKFTNKDDNIEIPNSELILVDRLDVLEVFIEFIKAVELYKDPGNNGISYRDY